MSRYLKIVCSLLVACSLFGAASPTLVQANDSTVAGSVDHWHHYDVHYGTCSHSARFYGSYDCPVEAQQVANHLRHQGYYAVVRSH